MTNERPHCPQCHKKVQKRGSQSSGLKLFYCHWCKRNYTEWSIAGGLNHEELSLCQQQRPYKTSTGYKGVCFNKRKKKYQAKITKRGVQYNLGYFVTAEEAARAYDIKALELYGSKAYLNVAADNSHYVPTQQ